MSHSTTFHTKSHESFNMQLGDHWEGGGKEGRVGGGVRRPGRWRWLEKFYLYCVECAAAKYNEWKR